MSRGIDEEQRGLKGISERKINVTEWRSFAADVGSLQLCR